MYSYPKKVDGFGTGIMLPGPAVPNQAVTGPCGLQLFTVLRSSGIKLCASHNICTFFQRKRLNLEGFPLGLVYLNTRLMARSGCIRRSPAESGEVVRPTTSFNDTHRTAWWVGLIAGPSVLEKIKFHCPCLELYHVFWVAQPHRLVTILTELS
jgi:hypothetical protein